MAVLAVPCNNLDEQWHTKRVLGVSCSSLGWTWSNKLCCMSGAQTHSVQDPLNVPVCLYGMKMLGKGGWGHVFLNPGRVQQLCSSNFGNPVRTETGLGDPVQAQTYLEDPVPQIQGQGPQIQLEAWPVGALSAPCKPWDDPV